VRYINSLWRHQTTRRLGLRGGLVQAIFVDVGWHQRVAPA
jgi:hypothetical protein